MTLDEIIRMASQAIEDTRSAVSLPIPFVLRFAALVAAAERAERAGQEAGKLLAYISKDRTQFFIPSMEGKDVKHAPYMAHWMAEWMPLYSEPPVFAPVRLTDRDIDGLAVPYSGMGGIEDYRAYAQAIETASLRANGFCIQPRK